MATPANALDITAAGLVKFDGTATFTGVTLTQHDVLVGASSNGITSVTPSTAGKILTSNGTGSDPSFKSPVYMQFISPTINMTLTGNSTIFTNGASNFVPVSLTFVADTIVNYSGSFSANIGFTAAFYNDYLNSIDPNITVQGNFQSWNIAFTGASGWPLLPPGIPLIANITGAIADSYTGRFIVFGYTV